MLVLRGHAVVSRHLLPALHRWRCPVAIDAAETHAAKPARVRQQVYRELRRNVLAIDQERHRGHVALVPIWPGAGISEPSNYPQELLAHKSTYPLYSGGKKT